MPRYTPDEKTAAIEQAARDGVPLTATARGINPGTLRRWAKAAGITPAVADPVRALNAEAATATASAVAKAARREREAAAEVDYGKLTTDAGRLAGNTLAVFGTTTGAVGQAEAVAMGLDAQAQELPDGPEREALVRRRDEAWRRVRRLSELQLIQARSYAIAARELARMAGADAPPPQAGASAAVVNLAVGVLLEDPELRAEVTGSLRERVAGRRGTPVIDVEADG